MLTRMVFKLLFKAMLPLVAVAGVTSYSLYLRGGDPGGMVAGLWQGAVSRIAGSARSATAGAGDALQALTPGTGSAGATTTEIYTWKDENGVTQFGNVAPVGVDAETRIIRNNINVVAPPPARPVASDRMLADGDSEAGGERLPGVAGMLHGDGRNVDSSAEQAEALMKLLQAR